MKVKGIDVSYWQGVIDWSKVAKDGIEFAMIRVGNRGLSKGSISKDIYFESNIKGALENGLKVGIYFFSSSINEQEAIEEAEFVLKNIKGYNITMPVVFDFEGFSDAKNRNYGMTKTQITANCIAFQNVIKAQGYTCMLYGSQHYLPKKFDLAKLTDPLWVAKYASSTKVLDDDKYKPSISGYNDRIAIWQCASCGTVDGIKGRVDIDYMYIDVSKKEETEEEKEVDNNPIKMYPKGKKVQLTKNFKSTEFDCNGKGCCSETPISTDLVKILQQVRDHFGVSVNLNCGYRCPVHNAKVKGASKNSKHMDGIASDIVVKGVHPMRVARFIETLPEFQGRIGVYTWDNKGNGFVHVDVRGTNSRAVYTENNTDYDNVTKFTVPIKRGAKGKIVTVVERFLASKKYKDEKGKSHKYYEGKIDESCGSKLEKGIILWNEHHGRPNDASWGKLCWGEAFPF